MRIIIVLLILALPACQHRKPHDRELERWCKVKADAAYLDRFVHTGRLD